MIAELGDAPGNEWRTKALIREHVRGGISSMMARLEAPFDPQESESHVASLQQQRDTVENALKARDWSHAAELASSHADRVGLPREALADPALAWRILANTRELLKVAFSTERDCEDPLRLGKNLLEEVGLKAERASLKPPMSLLEAVEKECDDAPVDVEKKIRATGRLAEAYFGDVPMASLTLDEVTAFLKFVWDMPKNWGQLHGKNRYEQVGSELEPKEIKRKADEDDAAVLAEIVADDSLSKPDKRRLLVDLLEPRQTDANLVVHRNMLNRIFTAALGGAATARHLADDERVVPSQKMLRKKLKAWHKKAKTEDGLPTRISRPKHRRSWSLEQLVKLLLSPIYTGSSSRKQRWRKPRSSTRIIQRDAIYWVPLFMIAAGFRPEEILQLKVKNVVLHEGVVCVQVGEDLDDHLKTTTSRRLIPVPDLLLRLGFREWVIGKRQRGDIWLFPEVEPDACNDRRSQTFGDRMRTLLDRLKLKFSDADIYAMRRTLASKLLYLKVETGTRQRILGHLAGTTIDKHYSDHGIADLKAILDEVDYGVEVGRVPGVGFPVITGCSTPMLPSADLTVIQTDQGAVHAVRVDDPNTNEVHFEARVQGLSTPKADGWQDLPAMTEKEIADRILALKNTYSLTFPGDDEAAAAVEHMLLLGDVQVSPRLETEVDVVPQDLESEEHSSDSQAGFLSPPNPAASLHHTEAVSEGAARKLGDTLLVEFPLSRKSEDTAPRPGLVVGVRTLGGRRYLDVARGAPIDQRDRISPHVFALMEKTDLSAAKLRTPTGFDLRRRVLITEDDKARIHGRLGGLAPTAEKRLGETLVFARDITPEPLCDRRRPSSAFTVERRSRKRFTARVPHNR